MRYDWNHPLPFGDSQWVEKAEVEPLTIAMRRLLDNIYEFGTPTDSELLEQVEEDLQRLLALCVQGHQGPFIRSAGGPTLCVTCRKYVDLDEQGKVKP
jgi:hypothetical protein